MTTTVTEQEYFDRACERLRDGTGQAVNAEGECRYLTEDGGKCVVGVFIPDGHKAQEFRGPVGALFFRYLDLAGVAWPDSYVGPDIAQALQGVHDDGASWQGTAFVAEDSLRIIARKYYLTYTPPARPSETNNNDNKEEA